MRVSEIYPYHRAHAPSSTLHSNVDDMCRWIQCLSHQGTIDDVEVISSESLEDMWKPRAQFSDVRKVGLSWFLSDHRGHRVISHSGADTGYRSSLEILPDIQSGVVVMANSGDGNSAIRYIRALAMELLVGEDPPPIEIEAPIRFELEKRLASIRSRKGASMVRGKGQFRL